MIHEAVAFVDEFGEGAIVLGRRFHWVPRKHVDLFDYNIYIINISYSGN